MPKFDNSKNDIFSESVFSKLDRRSRSIFCMIVESYLENGEPLGSRTLSRHKDLSISPSTIRNVMSDLEHLGLIFSPHTSAGRVPTELGLRFFVESFLEIGNLNVEESSNIERQICGISQDHTLDDTLLEASQMLSGLTQSAGLILTGKQDVQLKHIEFIRLDCTRALVVIVGDNDSVENRIISLPPGITAAILTEASNFINTNIVGSTFANAKSKLRHLHKVARAELNELASTLINSGLATWSGSSEKERPQLIISGHANLLDDLKAIEEIERIRTLFADLETKEGLIQLLDLAEDGEGVRIFIGSQNRLFSLSGSSVVIAPYKDRNEKVVGALGVIGPTRLNYSKVVPVVDYTAQLVSKLLRKRSEVS